MLQVLLIKVLVMAHGKNAQKFGKCGKEYWKSRLHKYGEVLGRYTKKLTSKKERRDDKKIIIEDLKEIE